MILYKNINKLYTLQQAARKQGRHVQHEDLSVIEKAAVVVDQGKILWLGEKRKLPLSFARQKKLKEIDLQKANVLPGFVECHTHSIFAGDRTGEFELRNMGVSYQDIAARGGGILTTVKATRKASAQQLIDLTQSRVNEFHRQGVTTLEIKTGYALNEKDELKCLQALQKIKGPEIVSTFLGAHSVPPEYKSKPEQYLKLLAEKVLPKIQKKNLSRRCDIFVEKGFFDMDMARTYLQKAIELGFQITIHADQLSLSGGADLCVELGALSGDHLLQVGEWQMQKLARSQVTCVLLPAADLYMKCEYPKARQMIEAGCRVALATDFNPGTSPTQDLALVGLLARLEMKMSLAEVIAAYTVGAAYALDLQGRKGSLEVGKDADMIAVDGDITDLFYQVGRMPVRILR